MAQRPRKHCGGHGLSREDVGTVEADLVPGERVTHLAKRDPRDERQGIGAGARSRHEFPRRKCLVVEQSGRMIPESACVARTRPQRRPPAVRTAFSPRSIREARLMPRALANTSERASRSFSTLTEMTL